MTVLPNHTPDGPTYPRGIHTAESASSAISWGAVLGGAFAASSVMLILLALGAGLGFAVISPWKNHGASAAGFGVATAISLIVVQWFSAAIGGYTAGRLRTKWSGVHTDEVYFRDTMHGFLAWSVGAVLGALLLSSAAGSLISGGAKAAGGIASGAAMGMARAMPHEPEGHDGGPLDMYTDTMFRPNLGAPQTTPAATNDAQARAEAGRILVHSVQEGSLSDPDKAYLSQLIAAHSGISQQEAAGRIDQAEAKMKEAEQKARQAADSVRKAAAYTSLFTGLSMLVGAFIAAAAGALGGLHRIED